MTGKSDDTLTKAARLLILMEMQDGGKLDGLSVPAIAKMLGCSRFTIYRDKAALPRLRKTITTMRKQLPHA